MTLLVVHANVKAKAVRVLSSSFQADYFTSVSEHFTLRAYFISNNGAGMISMLTLVACTYQENDKRITCTRGAYMCALTVHCRVGHTAKTLA